MRIVSLLPSLTEICFTLGLGNQLVGVTHECDFPAAASNCPRVTRSTLPPDLTDSAEIDAHVRAAIESGEPLYSLDIDLMQSLQPDLILTQELCPVCAMTVDEVREIAGQLDSQPQVVSFEPKTLEDMLQSILSIGAVTERTATADAVVHALRTRLDVIQELVARTEHRQRVVCLEWIDPPMIAGHWVPEMVEMASGIDPLGRAGEPSFTVSVEDVIDAAPDMIVLMPCGYSLQETLHEINQIIERGNVFPDDVAFLPAVQNDHVYAVDASGYFNRPGPRLVTGVEILAGILHAELAAGHTPPGSVEPVNLARASVRP